MPLLVLVGGAPPTVYEPETDWSAVQVTESYKEPAPVHWKEGDLTVVALRYTSGAELPTGRVMWNDWTDKAIDFSSGWTFLVKVGHVGQEPEFEKSAGVAGGDGFIDIQWDPGVGADLNRLAPGKYSLEIRARRNSDSRDRYRTLELIIEPGLSSTAQSLTTSPNPD